MPTSNIPLHVCLIGGSNGSFFPRVHNRAILLTERARVTCGVFSRDEKRSLDTAAEWPHNVAAYGTIAAAIAGRNFDYATIVTPNSSHFALAKAFIEAGIPILIEKPVTLTHAEAVALLALAEEKNVPIAVAHTYYGHWTTRLMAHVIRNGKLGAVRRVESFYRQGWLAYLEESKGQQQAGWRVDPMQGGASCCGGDIGTHAFAQVLFATGLSVSEIVHADLRTIVPGRETDDDFHTRCTLSNGAIATIGATQVAHGHRNDLSIEVNCEHGTVRWRQEDSENLYVDLPDGRTVTYGRGSFPAEGDPILGTVPVELRRAATLPGGHGEGFHDALALIHLRFGEHVRAWQEDPAANPAVFTLGQRDYPTFDVGVSHMRFLEAAAAASRTGQRVTL